MGKRAFYILVLAIAIAAIVLSFFFIPSKKEESLMYYYDKRYGEAYEHFKDLYQSGDHSLSVIMPLVWLSLNYAQDEKAIRILEEYVEKHPNDKQAREYLGTLYLDTNRPYDYLLNLEAIYKFDPDVKILRQREELYSQLGQRQARIKALNELIEKGAATIREYQELSYLYASDEELDKAILIAQKLLHEYPLKEMSDDTVSYLIGLFADYGEINISLSLARNFLYQNNNPNTILKFSSLLASRGNYFEALEILDLVPEKDKNLPVISATRIGLLLQIGEREKAYALLKSDWLNHTLWPKLTPDFITLASDYEPDDAFFRSLIEDEVIEELNSDAAFSIALRAIRTQDVELIHLLQDSLKRGDWNGNKAAQFAIALVTRVATLEEETFFLSLYNIENFRDKEKVSLAEIANLKGYSELAKEIISSIESFEAIDVTSLYTLASLYSNLGLSDEGLKKLEAVRKPSEEIDADDYAWLLLAASSHHTKEVEDFLNKHEGENPQVLKDIFDVAFRNEDLPFLLFMGEELMKESPGFESEKFYAVALLLNHRNEEAFKLFGKLQAMGYPVDKAYFEALYLASKEDKTLYPLLHAEIIKQIRFQKLSDNELREYAFLLEDIGYRKDALPIFLKLSKNKSYSDQDVQMLLYLWGEKLSSKQVKWVLRQLKETNYKEKGKWLKLLLDSKFPKEVLKLTDIEEIETDDDIREAYLESALLLHRSDLIREAVFKLILSENRLEKLIKLAWAAHYANLNELAEMVFEKAFTIDPRNREVIKGLALVSFFLGNNCLAKCYLNDFIDLFGADYLIFYTYGELLWREEYFCQALSFYNLTLEEINRLPEKKASEISVEVIKGISLARVGLRNQAFELFENLLCKYKSQVSIYSDYANLQMDRRDFRAATRILLRYHPSENQEADEDLNSNKFYYLSWVRLYKETNKIHRAISLLNALNQEYPCDPDILAMLADLYFVGGHVREATWLINDALSVRPYSSAFYRARDLILFDWSPFYGLNYEYRLTGNDQIERFTRFIGIYDINPYLRWGTILESDHLSDDDFTDMEGENVSIDVIRNRGEFWFEKHVYTGLDLRARFFLGEAGVMGVGGEYKRLWYIDRLTFGFEWNRPSWEFVESTAQFGSKDDVYVEGYHRFTNQLDGVLRLGVNRYNLKGLYDAASSWIAEGFLSYRVPDIAPFACCLGKDSQVNLVYQLDKEQKIDETKKINDEGETYRPLPLDSREEHTFYAFMYKRFPNCLLMELYGGFTFDRMAVVKHVVPTFGGALEYCKRRGWNYRAEYRYATSSEKTTQTVHSLNFFLRYYY